MKSQISKQEVRVRIERGSPDSDFVSKLAGVEIQVAEREVENAREDEDFRLELERTLAKGGRSNYIQICAPFELYALTKLTRPKHIVEVGVSAGVSSAYFLRAIEVNRMGVLHSIDLPEKEKRSDSPSKRKGASWALPAGKESGWGVPEYLKKHWDLRLGSSGDVLPILIDEIDSVDLFLYDVPYEIEDAKSDFSIVDRKLHAGSIVLADNCLVPITWWARKRNRANKIYTRKNSGLRGFSIP
jgi:predicted O-methyltransferase YrrM